MPEKMGRPKSDNTKDTMIRVRVDAETERLIKECRDALGISMSDVLRLGVRAIHQSVIGNKA